jgi:hypothetical protein
LNLPRVLLADDHSSVIERVGALLRPNFEAVGTVVELYLKAIFRGVRSIDTQTIVLIDKIAGIKASARVS